MKKLWHDDSWEHYLYWQAQDRKTVRRINNLVRDIERNGYGGIGKPEPLKSDLSGWWSCRIDEQNRIVFRIRDDTLEILQCKGHYEYK